MVNAETGFKFGSGRDKCIVLQAFFDQINFQKSNSYQFKIIYFITIGVLYIVYTTSAIFPPPTLFRSLTHPTSTKCEKHFGNYL